MIVAKIRLTLVQASLNLLKVHLTKIIAVPTGITFTQFRKSDFGLIYIFTMCIFNLVLTQDEKRAIYKELKGQILSWPSRGLTNPYLKALLSNLELLESQIIWPFKELRANLALQQTHSDIALMESQSIGPSEGVLRYFPLGLFKGPKWLFSQCVCCTKCFLCI